MCMFEIEYVLKFNARIYQRKGCTTRAYCKGCV